MVAEVLFFLVAVAVVDCQHLLLQPLQLPVQRLPPLSYPDYPDLSWAALEEEQTYDDQQLVLLSYYWVLQVDKVEN